MKIVFHENFYQCYTFDPAAAEGRMEPMVEALRPGNEFIAATPASEEDIALAHTPGQIRSVKEDGLFPIASLAAGGAIQAAAVGLTEPCFALIRPPGHHASADSAWGFCYFNNMAVAMLKMKKENKIKTALVLDIDLHFGDGTENILGRQTWVGIHNPSARDRHDYIREAAEILSGSRADLIGISAGFDHHVDDWGGLLETEDYQSIGAMVRAAARNAGGGCFAVLEGGYNHDVLGKNARALADGMSA
jgi:acetoin utilization deacetylase AcuC-like enzyme